MAVHRIPLLGWATKPDASGSVYAVPLDVVATNDVWDALVYVFADTATRIGLHGRCTIPQNYVGTAKLAVVWSTTATSGDVEWDCDYRAVGGDDAESLDQAGTQESVNLNDTAPSAVWERMECLITLTSANLAAGDELEFTLFRDGTDGGDTIAASVYLFNVLLEYADA